jgi:hypothetical protein
MPTRAEENTMENEAIERETRAITLRLGAVLREVEADNHRVEANIQRTASLLAHDLPDIRERASPTRALCDKAKTTR